jgi:16S rRNA (uracil1498-N3)-methyltransferase
VLIGPEGGITNREIAILSEKGALPISLGPRILRSETAGIMVLSAFLSQWGE